MGGDTTSQSSRWPAQLSSVIVATAGATLAVVSLWVVASAWDPIVNGHPSYSVLYSFAFVAAVGTIVLALREKRPRKRVATIAVLLSLFTAAAVVWWLQPFGAETVALDSLESDDAVIVEETYDSIVMTSTSEDRRSGVVFYPGARVDARAYAAILRPLAEEGHQVVIPKVPLGIAFLASGFAGDWAVSNPETEWVAAGHSLGGVVAAGAVDQVEALLLWASFPASDISDVDGIDVVSIYGTSDAIAVPEDILASAPDLPENIRFVAVEGAIHSYFGDYGLQPGDGTPGVDRAEAQDEIVAASLDLVNRVAREG